MSPSPRRRLPLVLTAFLCSAVVPSPVVGAEASDSRLSGVVRVEDGSVLSGAEVSLASEPPGVATHTTTDADGRYSMAAPPGRYHLSLHGESGGRPVDVIAGEVEVGPSTQLDIVAVRPEEDPPVTPTPAASFPGALPDTDGSPVTLEGDVRDHAGAPFPANEVVLLGPDRSEVLSAPVSSGAYELLAPPGRYGLRVKDFDWGDSAPDKELWLLDTTGIDLAIDTVLDLTLPREVPAHVIVVGTGGERLFGALDLLGTSPVTDLEVAPGVQGTSYHYASWDERDDGHFRPSILLPVDTWARFEGGHYEFTVPRLHLAPGGRVVVAVTPAAMPTVSTDHDPTPVATAAPTTGTPPADSPAGPTAGTEHSGYWMLGSDGRVYAFGDAAHRGDPAGRLGGAEALDLEATRGGTGYWIVDDRGWVFAAGDAGRHGDVDPGRLAPGETPTSLSATPSGRGYWIFTSRGRAIPFGDAPFLGDMSAVTLNGPVLDSIPTPTGRGYYMVAADGGVFSFDAPFRGSLGGQRLNRPVTGMVPYGNGYLMVGEDGGIFNFSDRPFLGSLGDRPPTRPVTSVAALG